MDRVQRGGPWTGSKGVVHGPGVHVLYTSSIESTLLRQKLHYKHQRQIFQHSVRNFISLCGHVISFISKINEPKFETFQSYVPPMKDDLA